MYTQISTTVRWVVIQYFIEGLQKKLSPSFWFHFWEFSILGIFPSAEKSLNLFFSSIDYGYNLMILLCWIMNGGHKENISSFQSSLCFSFLTFPVLIAIWNYKFASQILYSRHFAFQCFCQSRISGHNSPVYWKVFHLYCIISKPFHSSLSAGDQPRLIQGIRSGDGVGEDQETIA